MTLSFFPSFNSMFFSESQLWPMAAVIWLLYQKKNLIPMILFLSLPYRLCRGLSMASFLQSKVRLKDSNKFNNVVPQNCENKIFCIFLFYLNLKENIIRHYIYHSEILDWELIFSKTLEWNFRESIFSVKINSWAHTKNSVYRHKNNSQFSCIHVLDVKILTLMSRLYHCWHLEDLVDLPIMRVTDCYRLNICVPSQNSHVEAPIPM